MASIQGPLRSNPNNMPYISPYPSIAQTQIRPDYYCPQLTSYQQSQSTHQRFGGNAQYPSHVQGGPFRRPGYINTSSAPPFGRYPTAITPQLLSPFQEPAHLKMAPPPLSPPQGPKPGEVDTYPAPLRAILELSRRENISVPPSNWKYKVVHHVASSYMDNDREFLGKHDDLHAANLEAAEFFIGNYDVFLEDDVKYELTPSGAIDIEVETDGSMGGLVNVYVTDSKG